ncbi:entericidin A/B family lipoprotein [Bordetella genomosp. 12]|uniref:Entericidin n=1 Tax=Bordetella genomosp. 12 TaxID=463035 RepID=A0A261VAL1_9BORD|nr:entericidin A/B family lipoprotein [Bordetella genomosp. 12]OZI70801.1 entericidin [Bordetella genomosp. 12]
MKQKALMIIVLAMAAVSAGCNTVAGAGKDIERGGEAIQRGANK